MPNLPSLSLVIILQLIIYSSFINPLMALSQEEGNIVKSEEQINDINNSELPCLDSSSECVGKLTEKAIAIIQERTLLNQDMNTDFAHIHQLA